ncbi:hypothetical protein GALL_446390 [mine drainage metagenome]|uniref:Uncharacterized protein n=1 Tax=mine drainage metagenome TaxID=410659 RepID=A0A1J5PQ50_9ZZZZ
MVKRLANQALEFTDVAFDGPLARGSAGMTFALLILDPELVHGLLLEGFQRAGQRPDLVTALRISGVDGEIAGGHLQHRIAHGVQRPDNAAAHSRHGAEGQSERRSQKHKLECQRALGLGMLDGGILLGGIERAFGDNNRRGHVFDRKRAPLVSLHFGFLARQHGVHQTIPKCKKLRVEISPFRLCHRLDKA